MENKNNKGLIVLVIILIICVLGLLGYMIYDKTINKNNINNAPTTNTTTTKDKLSEKTIWEEHHITCFNENKSDECIAYDKGNIKLSYKEVEGREFFTIDIYLNDIKIKNNIGEMDFLGGGIKVTEIDENHILIEIVGQDLSQYYLYDNEGKMKTDFSEYSKINGKQAYLWLTYTNKEFKIHTTHQFVDWGTVNFCTDTMGPYKEDDVVEIESKIPVLENGELGQVEIVLEKKLKEVLYEDYGVSTCEEAIQKS